MTTLTIGLKEAAAALGVSHWTLRKWTRERKLRVIRLGKRIVVEPAELQRFIEAGRVTDEKFDAR